MGDEEDGEIVRPFEVLEQVEDLGLYRHVERGHDLVAHQELRFEHQAPGDADALALPTGELPRPAFAGDGGVDPDGLEHGVGGVSAFLFDRSSRWSVARPRCR